MATKESIEEPHKRASRMMCDAQVYGTGIIAAGRRLPAALEGKMRLPKSDIIRSECSALLLRSECIA